MAPGLQRWTDHLRRHEFIRRDDSWALHASTLYSGRLLSPTPIVYNRFPLLESVAVDLHPRKSSSTSGLYASLAFNLLPNNSPYRRQMFRFGRPSAVQKPPGLTAWEKALLSHRLVHSPEQPNPFPLQDSSHGPRIMYYPTHRLVGFYALDSICKNLGHPFPELFKASIERLFLTAYRDVENFDPTTKIKFEELLGTWRTGSVTQSELFGAELQRRMENGIFGSWGNGAEASNSQAFQNGMKQLPAIASPAEKASILFDLRRILADRRDIAVYNPTDQANLLQIDTLSQLEQLVANQQLTINQVDDIRKQLQLFKLSTAPPAPTDLSAPQSISHHHTPVHHPSQPPTDLDDSGTLAQLNQFLEANPNILQEVMQQSQLAQPPQAAFAQSTTNSALDPTFQDVSDILSQFVQPQPTAPFVPEPISHAILSPNLFNGQNLAAALTALNIPQGPNQTPVGFIREQSCESANKSSPSPSTPSSSQNSLPRDHPDPAIMEYENKIAGLTIELQSGSINRVNPSDIADLLYSDIPQFCRQDGSRFLSGKTGNQRASDQLDRYFRIQRQVRESGQRAQQRMWGQGESTWLYSQDSEHAGRGNGSQTRKDGSRSPPAMKRIEEEQEKLAELRRKTVIRPSSSGLACQPCPICLEPFDTKLDEDEDEFLWTNAIESFNESKQTKVIYHATCHFETVRNKKRMQLKSELEAKKLSQSSVRTHPSLPVTQSSSSDNLEQKIKVESVNPDLSLGPLDKKRKGSPSSSPQLNDLQSRPSSLGTHKKPRLISA
ncbi:hypothetical protein MJO28_006405 [Puccinia striiformis f. sp. tritici]|uniref:Uncharacterized protein n=1 Tax=Puccinia striiformis f. sp. tritici TaxID=168172 RepID=A0ACC0EHC5_9BASI|nr:hypothetical protein MJO28_006405 [Puccinia striiformis f. sp. tritici]